MKNIKKYRNQMQKSKKNIKFNKKKIKKIKKIIKLQNSNTKWIEKFIKIFFNFFIFSKILKNNKNIRNQM